jgi:hypothetical protein
MLLKYRKEKLRRIRRGRQKVMFGQQLGVLLFVV